MFLWLVLVVIGLFALGAVLGAPYVPILRKSSDGLFELIDLKPGATIIDLGSGDGAFAIEAAKRGYNVIGYEVNPILVLISRIRCFRYRKFVTIYLRDFWRTPLPRADAIYVFLIERYMQKLCDKLSVEIATPTLVASHVFAIPGKQAIKQNQNTYIYTF